MEMLPRNLDESSEQSENVIKTAIENAVLCLNGVRGLRPTQMQTVLDILYKRNIFKTAATGSGKTLPPCLVPLVARELRNLGVNSMPDNPHTLFLTPLNSIRDSLVSQGCHLWITCGDRGHSPRGRKSWASSFYRRD